MAACAMLRSGLGFLHSKLMVTKQACKSSLGVLEQVRGYYVDWRMLRDVKRRQMAYEFADTRLRINAIRKNTLLPKELQEVADKEIAALPRDSCPVRIRNSDGYCFVVRCLLVNRQFGANSTLSGKDFTVVAKVMLENEN
ncbi:hypothetical protein AOLI_G00113500 [Acnodon oligacanthus]